MVEFVDVNTDYCRGALFPWDRREVKSNQYYLGISTSSKEHPISFCLKVHKITPGYKEFGIYYEPKHREWFLALTALVSQQKPWCKPFITFKTQIEPHTEYYWNVNVFVGSFLEVVPNLHILAVFNEQISRNLLLEPSQSYLKFRMDPLEWYSLSVGPINYLKKERVLADMSSSNNYPKSIRSIWIKVAGKIYDVPNSDANMARDLKNCMVNLNQQNHTRFVALSQSNAILNQQNFILHQELEQLKQVVCQLKQIINPVDTLYTPPDRFRSRTRSESDISSQRPVSWVNPYFQYPDDISNPDSQANGQTDGESNGYSDGYSDTPSDHESSGDSIPPLEEISPTKSDILSDYDIIG